MDNFGMMRSPSLAPATLAEPPIMPPPLGMDDDDDLEEVGTEASLKGQGSLSMARSTLRTQVTELDFGPDGHIKPRHYQKHSPTMSGRLLDFVGVPTHLTVRDMIISLLTLFLPATATTVLFFCNQAVTMMFVGQLLGVKRLAHYAVGISVFNICGLSIGLGMATALDTLCSQAYGRNPRSPEVGILLQRGLLVCLALAVPVIIGFHYVEPVLIDVFGKSLGRGVAAFLLASPPYLVALITNFCLQKALQAQQLPILAVWANIASACSCPLFNMWLTPYGVDYALWAVSLSVLVAIIVMVLGAATHPKSVIKLARFPHREAFSWDGIVEFLHVGVPGCLSVVAEWWAFEFIIAFSSQYGEDVVTGFTICMNILTFMFAIPSGLAVAAGVMCGNFLGANDPRGARSFARMAIILGAILVCIVDVLMFFFGRHMFALYTKDEQVLGLLQNVIYLLLLFHIGDATQTVLQGVFRGAGRQYMSARIVLVSLWLVGLPASWILGRKMPPLDGILTGLVLGFAVEIPLLTVDMLFRWDWEALAEQAAKSKIAEVVEHQHLRSMEGGAVNYGTA
jgi:MATE family multidrug resistance protein